MKARILGCAIVMTLLRTLAHGQIAPITPRECPAGGKYLYDVQKLLNQFVTPTYDSDGNRLVITATHRGNWEVDPDNSISAFESAFLRGDEALESDVRMDADGTLWNIHDDVLNRQTSLIPPDPTKAEYIADTHTARLNTAFLRDRFGNITKEPLEYFDELLYWYYAEALCRKPGSNEPYGPVLVIDVKGAGLNAASGRQYDTLVATWKKIKSWNSQNNLKWSSDPGLGLILKVHLNKIKDIQSFANDLGLTDDIDPKTKNWNHNFLFVINPEDPAPGAWPQYQAYSRAKFTLDFELNQNTPKGPIYQKGWYEEFASYVVPDGWGTISGKTGRSLQQYLEQDSYPEGHPTGGTCCRVTVTPPFGTSPDATHTPPYTWKGYFVQFFSITDVMTVDQPAVVNSAYGAVKKRDMEVFK